MPPLSTVIATLASAAPDTASTSLSQTGKLISFLLTGQPSPQPASLAANQPLLQAPPTAGQALAPLLKQAISESGLFYESHQARWLSGETDAATLMREPQGRSPAAGTQPPATGRRRDGRYDGKFRRDGHDQPDPAGGRGPRRGRSGHGPARRSVLCRPGTRRGADSRSTAAGGAPATRCAGNQPLCLAGHGVAGAAGGVGHRRPQRRLRRRRPRGRAGGLAIEPATDPAKLGAVEARLHLTDAGVSLHFVADEDAAEPLRRGRAELAEALAQASVPMTGMSVEVTAREPTMAKPEEAPPRPKP